MSMREWEKVYNEKCTDFPRLPSILPPVKRIIVLGDLHGDWDMTIKSLRVGKLIDTTNKWIGFDTVVVQLGDQIDRCRFTGIPCYKPEATKEDEASDIKILNFFTNLHKQAQKEGGAVYSIIGNHELMNVNGDMRYVSFENIAEFNNYEKPDGTIIANGIEARKYAFAPGNKIADFLGCTRQLSLIIGSNLFVHAGVLPKIAKKYNIQEMNQIMSLYLWNKLKDPSEYNELLNSSDYSPLWNRIFGSTKQTVQSCDNLMRPLEEIYKVGKIFIGHTPQLNTGISNKCKEKIWLADYGASKAFNPFDNNFIFNNKRSTLREAQVLEILDDGKKINILK